MPVCWFVTKTSAPQNLDGALGCLLSRELSHVWFDNATTKSVSCVAKPQPPMCWPAETKSPSSVTDHTKTLKIRKDSLDSNQVPLPL